MTDIVTWLGQQLDEDKRCALATGQASSSWQDFSMDGELRDSANGGTVAYVPRPEDRAHIARHDPASVLRRVGADRAILAEVASWQHDYVDGDTWLSCAQAVSEFDEERRPGSGCADEKRRGGPCDCGLERRRNAILYPLVQSYDNRPGFKDEWRA